MLQKVQGILTARTDLKLEIQGHTDNVGSDEYNQKLSESRASSVVAWLTVKGVAADRLTARGLWDETADRGQQQRRTTSPQPASGAKEARLHCKIAADHLPLALLQNLGVFFL